MTDESLTPEEERALAALPREAPLPAGLEDRVVSALGRAGHLLVRRPARSRWWLQIAAALVLVGGGIAVGRVTAAPVAGNGPGFLLLLYGSASAPGRSESDFVAEYSAWAASLRAERRLVAAERLAPESQVLGNAIPGGAQPVGFFLIRADTDESAIAAARSCPHLKYGGTVVVKSVE